MNLQISVIGIGIIALYSAVVILLIARPLWRWLRDRRWRWAVIVPIVLPLLAAPWAEEAWIAWHFAQACKDAGVHVYRTVEVEGFYDATGSGFSKPGPLDYKPAIESLDKAGYRFYEKLVGYDPHANPLRVSHVEKVNSEWQVTILDRPTARYYYKYAYQPTPYVIEEPVGWKLQKIERQVVDSATGELLGRDALFKRFPSVAEALWVRFLGSGITICPGPKVKPFVPQPSFPEAVLKPTPKN